MQLIQELQLAESEYRLPRYLRTWNKYSIRQAKLPMPKTVQEFNFTKLPKLPKMKVEQLVGGAFVARHENVICLGKPGTGKSHIATAIGMGAFP